LSQRFAIYYAPPPESELEQLAANWLWAPDLLPHTGSARRYGFHATIKAPMLLKSGATLTTLSAALGTWCRRQAPVSAGRLELRQIDGFLAIVCASQPQELTDFAARVVEDFDPLRAPLSAAERKTRLAAPLTDRQIKLVDLYGYPYVFEQFLFHMTLTDRLSPALGTTLTGEARKTFAAVLTAPLTIDRLVIFREPEPGAPFERCGDFVLEGRGS
jgi:hypothetical protein